MIVRLAIFVIVTSAGAAFAGEVHIAVAANFLGPLKTIAKAYERSTGHKALLSAGSTGQLYSQIINGAPYGVFLAADRQRPELLESGGFIAKGSSFTYAIGRLALYSVKKSFVDANGNVLRSEKFRR
ncbi:Molybdenum ABC transporter, periplasmic molybdenum-binding protein ModA (TC 3.A.1.8.1), partial [hydrothermal vent metagenome]